MAYVPKFTISTKLLGFIEDISSLREKILAASVQVTWIPRLQQEVRARNAHSSTAIEGNPLTLEQVRALEEGREVPAVMEQSRREVLNYFAGLRFIERHQDRNPLTPQDVLKLHQVIAGGGVMKQGDPGRFRTGAVRVGRFVPPPAVDVPRLMSELLEWWNRQAPTVSPILTSSIVHYRFEAIHPFADGNGRTGRALALWELYRRGFDTHHIFSVDEWYWEDRPRYYAALDAVHRQGEDLSRWLEYTAEGLRSTLEKVWMRVEHLKSRRDSEKLVLRPKQEQLLELLRDRRSMAPREIWDALGISKQGARDLLKPLMEAGLVRRIGTRKSGRYLLESEETLPLMSLPDRLR